MDARVTHFFDFLSCNGHMLLPQGDVLAGKLAGSWKKYAIMDFRFGQMILRPTFN
jgi:hypothetical protein